MKKAIFYSIFTFQQLIAQNVIQIYNAYGNSHTLIVEGRVLDEREFQETSKDDSIFLNIWRKLGHIFNDEVKHTPIILKYKKHEYKTSTDNEGYFSFKINLKSNILNRDISIYLYTPNQPKVNITVTPFIPSTKKQLGVISDFDDTLIISNVTQKLSLINQLLFKNYKQRKVVDGMIDRINKILINSIDKPFFIITGSPKQLNSTIKSFLNYHNFPKYTLITKQIHGRDAFSLFKQYNYKFKQIERLLNLYPKIEWILFGDSTEADREIYLNLAKKYPDKIKEIYIRDVKKDKIEKVY